MVLRPVGGWRCRHVQYGHVSVSSFFRGEITLMKIMDCAALHSTVLCCLCELLI